jgi:hypothetical protein
MTAIMPDTRSTNAPKWAVRHPKRGKAHRLTTDAYSSTLHPNSTVCGRWGRDMTERIDVARTDPSDRCTRCWTEATS